MWLSRVFSARRGHYNYQGFIVSNLLCLLLLPMLLLLMIYAVMLLFAYTYSGNKYRYLSV